MVCDTVKSPSTSVSLSIMYGDAEIIEKDGLCKNEKNALKL